MKINRNFNAFIDFKSLELEVPMFCLVTGCVSARRDRRYLNSIYLLFFPVRRVFRQAGMDVNLELT
jgi:hypothetical protein